MKIKIKLLIYIIVMHILLFSLALLLLKYGKYWLLAAETLVITSLFIAIHLYKMVYKPLEFSKTGAESLKSKDFNLKYIPTGNYETDILINLYNEMIDELRAERILSQEKNFFLEKLIAASPVGIIILDFDGNISEINLAALKLLSIKEERIIKKDFKNIQSEILDNISNIPINKTRTITINGAKKYKCYKSHFIDKGFQRYFIIIEELTSDILEAEKQAYGKVIRMMAHEVNNSVGSVNSLLDTIRFYKDELPQKIQNEYINAIKVAIERNKNLGIFISNFADVIRLPKPQTIESDICALLKRTIILTKHITDEKDIRIQTNGLEEIFLLKFDPIQMEQVILNILKNAIESIDKQGSIIISVSRKEQKLNICDNGKGILPENTKKIFTPFFSTKIRGQGIGLTLVRDILYNHGFLFSLQTKTDGNTCFEIHFNQK